MTDQQIIDANCGVPPVKEKLEYTIWLNEKKLNFYSRNRHNANPLEHAAHLKGYANLIELAKKELKKIEKLNPSVNQ